MECVLKCSSKLQRIHKIFSYHLEYDNIVKASTIVPIQYIMHCVRAKA